MRDRSYFLREDLATYKRKFKLLCQYCTFQIRQTKSLSEARENKAIKQERTKRITIQDIK